jgi:dienelactone hydrolase
MKTYTIDYQDGDTTLQAYVALDENLTGPRPAVLVAHDWTGRNEFACQKAEFLTSLGYVGIAIDMFGKGVLGQNNEQKMQLITPLVSDRAALRRRVLAGFDVAVADENVDGARVAAIGFCFGGMCVLDLARAGADLKGVVSFHGLLGAPEGVDAADIQAKILALHGHDDPMVPPEQVLAFQQEMTKAKVDWQMHIYGQTQHAFTNPQANDTQLGTVYNAVAERRALDAMEAFFREAGI